MASLARSRRWEVAPYDPAAAEELERSCGVTPLVARIMAGRGITDPGQAARFLTPSLERDWEDPLLIPGLDEVVGRLGRALDAGERIAVFGDFDVDGISATCLLTSALRAMGGHVTPFIPRRFDEGYGISQAAVARLLEVETPDLLVTVDTGIAAEMEVEELLAAGIDVAVTDHHEPGDLVPRGVPVCDPKIDPGCPSRELAGVGVALKVVCVLGARRGMPDLWRTYTDIATLGTVSDMMLLTGENRALVADGVARLRTCSRRGLNALAQEARRPLETMTADDLAFSLIPRLNAAGRMDDPAIALQLLMAEDDETAQALAARLEEINRERRSIEAQLDAEATAMVEATYDGGRVIVVGGEGWHEGVKGIVASRLVGRYHVPVILFTISDGIARGSGRSVGSVNLFQAVDRCSDLLVRFGGHAGAVGVTLEVGNLDAFRDRMRDVLAALPEEQFEDRSVIAAQVSLSEMTVDTVRSLSVMRPFGQGNEVPVLAACGATMSERRRRGEDGRHLSFNAHDASGTASCIMFNARDVESLSECDGAVDLVFEPKVEEWQGRVSAKLHVKDVLRRDVEDASLAATPAAALVDDLFERADEFLNESELAGLANAPRFFTRVADDGAGGLGRAGRPVEAGEELGVRRVPEGQPEAGSAVLVDAAGTVVGRLKRIVAAAIVPKIDRGAVYSAVVQTPGAPAADGRPGPACVLVGMDVPPTSPDEVSVARERAAERARLAGMGTAELTEELRALLIGDNDLLPAQERALANLDAATSTLCVMATGRGKSLIFHVHAARQALLHHRASVFVYPLRALVSDQAFHLGLVFDRLGMTTRVLTGATPLDERAAVFAGLAAGTVDIVLTTPEFLAIHAAQFAAEPGRVGFVVVDEAHHAAHAAGERPAYLEMPRVLQALGDPVVLAVTATADAEAARAICSLLAIPEGGVVVDASRRDNLHVLDRRGWSGRDEWLVSLLATGEKSLVYVNSREQTVALARMLRRRVWEFGHRVAFYNGGLSRADRAAVEEAFRAGDLTMVVSTSAFGEGVNLPDVRHVVLYHMPFNEVEFNQMSGRAGRDGADAQIHLAYGVHDARLNERVIAAEAPTRDDLVVLYRVLAGRARAAARLGQGDFSASNAELAADCASSAPSSPLGDHGVSCGIAVFRELGFVETTGYGVGRRISVVPSPDRMDLTRSIRYLEGLRALEAFATFRQWACEASPDEVQARVASPIVPVPDP